MDVEGPGQDDAVWGWPGERRHRGRQDSRETGRAGEMGQKNRLATGAAACSRRGQRQDLVQP